jgi:hypothetical protein
MADAPAECMADHDDRLVAQRLDHERRIGSKDVQDEQVR